MRMIGSLPDESSAKRFSDYLLTLGMDAHVEESSQGHAIWVEHDDHLDRAKAELATFATIPGDPRYNAAPKAATALRKDRDRQSERRRRNFTDVRTSMALAAAQPAPVTVALILLCLVVYVATRQGTYDRAIALLRIVPTLKYEVEGDQEYPIPGELRDAIRGHQYWRFVTPILVHHGLLHVIFNMSWLLNFGGQIERAKGSQRLVWMILVISIPSNLAQHYFSGPFFGGMSGVVYGLFGYIWIKSRLQPHEKLGVDQTTVYFMIGWMVLCMTLLDNIANEAHFAGLVTGVALGAAPWYFRKLKRSAGA